MNMPLAIIGFVLSVAAGGGAGLILAGRAMENHDEAGPRRLTALRAFLALAAFTSGITAAAWCVDTWGTDDRPCAEYSYALIKGVRYQTCARYWDEAPQ